MLHDIHEEGDADTRTYSPGSGSRLCPRDRPRLPELGRHRIRVDRVRPATLHEGRPGRNHLGARGETRVAPRAVRRPADKARRGSLLAIFDRGATPFRRDASPLECSGGFTTGSWPAEDLTPSAVARAIDQFARTHDIAAVSVDGPQGWRDAAASSKRKGVGRACEYATRTPGKTGTRGVAYPSTFLRWIRFSIEVFAELLKHPDVALISDPSSDVPLRGKGYWLLECFPTSTWRTSGLDPLPGHRRAPSDVVEKFAKRLVNAYSLPSSAIRRARPWHPVRQTPTARVVTIGRLRCLATGTSDHRRRGPTGDPPRDRCHPGGDGHLYLAEGAAAHEVNERVEQRPALFSTGLVAGLPGRSTPPHGTGAAEPRVITVARATRRLARAAAPAPDSC